MMKVYGIPNCNTVKKAITWLKENDLEYAFHNYKKDGITKDQLKEWLKVTDWEKLVNKKGTTWRSLTAEQQDKVNNSKAAIELMIEKPSVIKRPVIELPGKLLIGFNEDEYKSLSINLTPSTSSDW